MHFSHIASHFFTAPARKGQWSFIIAFPNPLEQFLLLISSLNPDPLHNALVAPVCFFKFLKNNEQRKIFMYKILTLKTLDGMLIITTF